MLTINVKTFQELSTMNCMLFYNCEVRCLWLKQDCVYQDVDDKDQKALQCYWFKNDNVVAYTRIFKTR